MLIPPQFSSITLKLLRMEKNFLSLKVLLFSMFFYPVLTGLTNKTFAQVNFSVTASVNNNVNTGTFTSTGLQGKSGDFLELYMFNGKKSHSEVSFIYPDGTITAKTHSDIIITSSSTAFGIGSWIITKGTGVYSGISGSGTLELFVKGIGTPKEKITQEWSGWLK